jgi:hypothetical protein
VAVAVHGGHPHFPIHLTRDAQGATVIGRPGDNVSPWVLVLVLPPTTSPVLLAHALRRFAERHSGRDVPARTAQRQVRPVPAFAGA